MELNNAKPENFCWFELATGDYTELTPDKAELKARADAEKARADNEKARADNEAVARLAA